MSLGRVAMVSPFPPKQTGIADHSAALALALCKRMDLTLFDFGEDATISADLRVRGMSSVGALVKALSGFDCVIYHLGNQPHFHRDVALAMMEHPGLAVLHDTVLYYLAAGMGDGGLAKALAVEMGLSGVRTAKLVHEASPGRNPLRYQESSNYPCLRWIASSVRAAIVHNHFSATRLRQAGFEGPLDVIPLLAKSPDSLIIDGQRTKLRAEIGIPEKALVIGSFGFVAATKRLDKLFEALSPIRSTFEFRILIVGTGTDISEDVRRFGLGDRTIRLGYVPDAQFSEYLQLTDILVNLRYPSMGESSSPLSKGLAVGLPAIVTDHGSFAELPNDVVIKIPYGDEEVTVLRAALQGLMRSPELRATYRARALAFAGRELSPTAVAEYYQASLLKYLSTYGSGKRAEWSATQSKGHARAGTATNSVVP
jgi:glycosyltransferase involved in cell wall biosynthesis